MGGLQPDGRLALIGSFCLGVVWGWWSVPLTERGPRLVPALAITTILAVQSGMSVWFSDVRAVAAILGGWLLGWLVNGLFRIALRMRVTDRRTP